MTRSISGGSYMYLCNLFESNKIISTVTLGTTCLTNKSCSDTSSTKNCLGIFPKVNMPLKVFVAATVGQSRIKFFFLPRCSILVQLVLQWHQKIWRKLSYNNYMASSASGQDESNPALWLATRVGKTELSCLVGTTHRVRKNNFPKIHIINPLLTKLVRSRLAGYWPCSLFDSVSVHKLGKKNLANSQPCWPHTDLVNNPYILYIHITLAWKLGNISWENFRCGPFDWHTAL